MTLGPQESNFLVYWLIWIFFYFFDLEIWWRFQIRYYTFPQITLWPQMSNFLVYGPIWNFFFFDLEIRWGFKTDIVLYLKWLTGPQKFNFLFMDRFEEKKFLWLRNSMGIPNKILYFTSNDSLDHNSQIYCLWTDLNIFSSSLTWNFDFNSNDSLDLKSL